jgi:hypothetical protein
MPEIETEKERQTDRRRGVLSFKPGVFENENDNCKLGECKKINLF